jgi:pyruvate,orthophosphate dikinase
MSEMKWVYDFSASVTEGRKEMKDLLGGKGANLAEMSSLGLPVPPGFTLTTEASLDFFKNNGTFRLEIKDQILTSLRRVETLTKKKFGDLENPLLFSIRSGAKVSMPGMMDTVLNLGLNDKTVLGLEKQTGNSRFAWDSYRRFIQMFGNVVMGLNSSLFESILEDLKEARGIEEDGLLDVSDLKKLICIYKQVILENLGIGFPEDPWEQLWQSVASVFKSWNNERASTYRELNGFDHDWGTAVNIQSMVFGNMGNDSGTGVCFTRDPSTGEKIFFGEFLLNAQGEDVVAGIRVPGAINEESKNERNKNFKTLQDVMPDVYEKLEGYYKKLEFHYKDMQDIEFTIEKGTLYILQTRSGKRTALSALKIVVDMVEEGALSKEDAILKISADQIGQLLHPRLDPKATKKIIGRGLPASPGAASGEIVFSSEDAILLAEEGKNVLLVRQETSPEDISGMVAAEGILTARGGMTSHAAVVARGMGKPCVAGCNHIVIDSFNKKLILSGKTYEEGDYLTIEGSDGLVMEGIVPTISAEMTEDFSIFMRWVDSIKKLAVRANAENSKDVQMSLELGAEGIGLCRTEHMFFGPERILAVREMIFSETSESREKALKKTLPFQKQDFYNIFKMMEDRPVNIRLLDPPLHEFLPHTESEQKELASHLGVSLGKVKNIQKNLEEFNPMLGHRGCRLAISFPEIYKMQIRAIIEAGIEVKSLGGNPNIEIMIPLIADNKELKEVKKDILNEIELIFSEKDEAISFKIGTMIELPRAAILAKEIAKEAEFFSFGTNDLTQMTFGLSRDDSGRFLPDYLGKKIFTKDPFVSLDQKGVGFLIAHGVKEGRKGNPNIHFGICGEHGGDPQSIQFCHHIGLDYVSCSPFRIPIARLAAAQAVLND